MHIEKLEDVTQQISKHAVADNPIWRQTTVRIDRARRKRESTKVQLFSLLVLKDQKRVNESSRELEAKRWRECQLPSIVIKSEQVQTL